MPFRGETKNELYGAKSSMGWGVKLPRFLKETNLLFMR